ncbi:MAG: DNA-binding protein [Verrucomicrobia bacterium]|nr:DNA-binding protein [Verrucomicrobiota bacterium]
MNKSPSALLNKFQAAERLGIHPQTVLKLTRLQRLECFKLGSRSYRYSEEQLNRFLAGSATGGKR